MLKISALLLILVFSSQILSQSCPRNQFLFAGSCVTQCPETHISQSVRGVKQCIECPLNRFQVPNLQRNTCQCAVQYYRDASGTCTNCHYSCLTCRGPNQNQCSSCSSESFETHRVRKGNQCSCIEGFYERPDKLICERCHPDCFTCSGPEDSECTECGSGRVKNQEGYCVCSGNFVVGTVNECVCPPPFTVDSRGQCINGQNECGVNEVQVGVKIRGKSNKSCQCRQGLVQIKGVCGTCGQNETYNERNKKCQCIQGAIKLKDSCIVCDKNQIWDRRLQICTCKKNQFKSSSGICVRCKPKEILINDKCECIANYYRDSNAKCKRCNPRVQNEGCQINQHNFRKEQQLSLRDI